MNNWRPQHEAGQRAADDFPVLQLGVGMSISVRRIEIKATLHSVRQFYWSTIAGLLAAVLGCGNPVATTSPDRPTAISAASLGPVSSDPSGLVNFTRSANGKMLIDAGIVFSNRSSYFCFPLENFGIRSAGQVQSVGSTCECVRPSLVKFWKDRSETTDGLLIEFSPEEGSESNVVPLRVAVSIDMRDQPDVEFDVDLLLTHISQEGDENSSKNNPSISND